MVLIRLSVTSLSIASSHLMLKLIEQVPERDPHGAEVLLSHIPVYGLQPVRHHSLPHGPCDNLVRHEAKQSSEPFLDMFRARGERLPVTKNMA